MSCETSRDIELDDVNVASVVRLGPVTLKRKGVVWDLSAGTVSFVLEAPDRTTQTTVAAVAFTDGSDGEFYYDTLVTDITQEGDWTMGISVTDGADGPFKFPYQIGFRANDNP